MSKIKNEIKLVNADILFSIEPNCTALAKSHYKVNVEFSPSFQTRDQYLEFRKSWKNLYKRLSHGIRLLRPAANFACQELPLVTYHSGRHVWPHHNVSNALFFWRMHAKAMLVALALAKKIAGEQRDKNICGHCLRRDCECSESDVSVNMGAKG